MTSLNGLGFSISMLKLADTGLGSGLSMIDLLDAPAEATGWSPSITAGTWGKSWDSDDDLEAAASEESASSNLKCWFCHLHACQSRGANGSNSGPILAQKALSTALHRGVAAEPDITRYDTVVGDGDCGISLKRGAEGKS